MLEIFWTFLLLKCGRLKRKVLENADITTHTLHVNFNKGRDESEAFLTKRSSTFEKMNRQYINWYFLHPCPCSTQWKMRSQQKNNTERLGLQSAKCTCRSQRKRTIRCAFLMADCGRRRFLSIMTIMATEKSHFARK